MSVDAKKHYGLTVALFTFGVLAFYGGTGWLLVLIPAALPVWHAAAGKHSADAAIDAGRRMDDGQ